jgi:hypothetical protein
VSLFFHFSFFYFLHIIHPIYLSAHQLVNFSHLKLEFKNIHRSESILKETSLIEYMQLQLHSLVTLLSLVSIASCQTTSGKIAGVGIGTFIIIIAIAFSLVWCLACRSSSYPEVYSIIGVVIPVILILIFIFLPK